MLPPRSFVDHLSAVGLPAPRMLCGVGKPLHKERAGLGSPVTTLLLLQGTEGIGLGCQLILGPQA